MTEEEIRDICVRVTEAMASLRWAPAEGSDGEVFAVPSASAPPPEVMEFLVEVRSRLDQAEVYMTEAGRAKAAADLMFKQARAKTDETYDSALESLSRAALRREYESVRDREVQARVRSSELRRAQLAAERLADYAAAADREASRAFFGLLNIREETLTRLRNYLPWESHLERS